MVKSSGQQSNLCFIGVKIILSYHRSKTVLIPRQFLNYKEEKPKYRLKPYRECISFPIPIISFILFNNKVKNF